MPDGKWKQKVGETSREFSIQPKWPILRLCKPWPFFGRPIVPVQGAYQKTHGDETNGSLRLVLNYKVGNRKLPA